MAEGPAHSIAEGSPRRVGRHPGEIELHREVLAEAGGEPLDPVGDVDRPPAGREGHRLAERERDPPGVPGPGQRHLDPIVALPHRRLVGAGGEIAPLHRGPVGDGRRIDVDIPEVIDEHLSPRGIMSDEALEPLLLELRRLRGIDDAPRRTGTGEDLGMVGLGATVECGEEVVALGAEIELVDDPPARRCQPDIERAAGDADLGAAVKIPVAHDRLDPRSLPAATGPVKERIGLDELAVDGIAEMGEIDAAERPVPVGTVALAAVERRCRPLEPFGIGIPRAAHPLEPLTHRHRPGVHLVGFGVAEAEVAPAPPADERRHGRQARIGRRPDAGPDTGRLRLRRQNPLGHLAIAAFGQPHRPGWRRLPDDLRREAHLHPVGARLEEREQPLEPSLLEAGPMGVGPDAELLPVVAEHRKRSVAPGGEAAEMIDRLFRGPEGDDIPEPLAHREDRERRPVPLGEPVAVELILGKTGGLEVGVVEDRPLDSGAGEISGHARIPHPFRQPHAADARLEAALEPGGVAADLADPVAWREHRQDRLVERPADNLDLAFVGQPRQPVEILRVVVVEPLGERAAGVDGDADTGVALEEFEERLVGILPGLFEDAVEVADRLMVVDHEDKPDGGGHAGPRRRRGPNRCRTALAPGGNASSGVPGSLGRRRLFSSAAVSGAGLPRQRLTGKRESGVEGGSA